MIRRNLIKAFALGLCMSSFFAGAAYAQAGAGSTPSFGGVEVAEAVEAVDDITLYKKQKEMDQYLFVDHVKDIEEKGFKVVYTGVAESYVEVGITPYSEKNAEFLYNIFGRGIVKVVDTEAAITLVDENQAPDAPDTPVSSSDTMASPIIDMGEEATDSDAVSDDVLIMERQLIADAEEEVKVQIESINDSMPEDVTVDGEKVREAYLTEDLPTEDDAVMDIAITSVQDDAIGINSNESRESEKNDITKSVIIAIAAGGIIIIGGAYFATVKKRSMKSSK